MELQHSAQIHSRHQGGNSESQNEVSIDIDYKNTILTIDVKDVANGPLELEKTHEKWMHLIIVSEDLNEFHHLHPEIVDETRFQAEVSLKDHLPYKAFVDLKPADKHYDIRPIFVQEGRNVQKHLMLDKDDQKTIQGKIIELTHSPFVTGQPVELHFRIKNGSPETYLGARGHVVIIDEQVGTFIHVHPKSKEATIFEAHFETAGRYKLWAEFKFGHDVIAFPYVFDVKDKNNMH